MAYDQEHSLLIEILKEELADTSEVHLYREPVMRNQSDFLTVVKEIEKVNWYNEDL